MAMQEACGGYPEAVTPAPRPRQTTCDFRWGSRALTRLSKNEPGWESKGETKLKTVVAR